jgi:phage baseplate assembly protein W
MPVAVKYYPEDIGKEFGTLGIKFPMNNLGGKSNGGMFNMSYTTEEQAVSNYVNLLLTRKGERYMQPNYGIGIQDSLFEQSTDVIQQDIELEIKHQAGYWLPYIINHQILVNLGRDVQIPTLGGESDNGIHVVITFSVTESGANRTITIFQTDGITRFEIGN